MAPSDRVANEKNRTKTNEEIRETLSYHAPSEKGIERHAALTQAFMMLMIAVDEIVPPGREKSIVFTHIEEAKMMASAGVARNPETV